MLATTFVRACDTLEDVSGGGPETEFKPTVMVNKDGIPEDCILPTEATEESGCDTFTKGAANGFKVTGVEIL